MHAIPIRLLPGDDLKQRLDKLAWEKGWRAACVVTCVGSLSSAQVRFANQVDIIKIEGPLEIVALSGTIASFGGSHLHLCVSDAKGQIFGGHLKEGSIVRTTAEVVIGVIEGFAFHRELDPKTGFPELVVGPA